MSCCLKGNEKKHICIIPPLLYYFLIYIFFDIVATFRFYQIKFWIKFTSGLLVYSYVVPNKSSLSQAWKTRKLFLSQRLVWFSYKAVSYFPQFIKSKKRKSSDWIDANMLTTLRQDLSCQCVNTLHL